MLADEDNMLVRLLREADDGSEGEQAEDLHVLS